MYFVLPKPKNLAMGLLEHTYQSKR